MKIFYRFFPLFAFLVIASFFMQCGTSVYYVKPPDWQSNLRRDSTIESYASVLRGRTIFLDPGHGGEDRKSVGPAGDVVEADVNLRVALFFRDYLKQAGANVLLSREADQTVALEARAKLANANNADIFISIHHNATENAFTNYTSTFYHATPGKAGYHPSSHDLARYIQRDLAFVMGNPGSLASFDGTLSDYLLYPSKGFAVLREAKMPAVLVECAFFTSAYEEQRLKREEFNRIQAWGIFRGLGKYLLAGAPTIAYLSPVSFNVNRPVLEISMTDRSGIDDESIRVYVDGKEEGFSFNAKTGLVRVTPGEELTNGYHLLSARVRNKNVNHSFPFAKYFSIGKSPMALKIQTAPNELPADARAFSIVTITPVDSAEKSLPDGLPLRITSSNGIDTTLMTVGGKASLQMFASDSDAIQLSALHGPLVSRVTIGIKKNAFYTRGLIVTSDGKPASEAEIIFPDGKKIVASADGEYIVSGIPFFGVEMVVQKKGFFSKRETFLNELVQEPILLSAV